MTTHCPQCKKKYDFAHRISSAPMCTNCLNDTKDNYQGVNPVKLSTEIHKNNYSPEKRDNESRYSILSLFLFLLAGLSFLICLILCAEFWPSSLNNGKEWRMVAYIPSITWFIAGTFQSVLFISIGEGLHYLKRITSNTDPINNPIQSNTEKNR